MGLWAMARPHEWGLIFGTPIPGYHAPHETVEPYTRIAEAVVRPLAEAHRGGRLRADREMRAASPELRAAIGPVADGLLPGMPVEHVVAATEAWTTVVGAISLEVFGHWRNTILDPAEYFEAVVSDAARGVGLVD